MIEYNHVWFHLLASCVRSISGSGVVIVVVIVVGIVVEVVIEV